MIKKLNFILLSLLLLLNSNPLFADEEPRMESTLDCPSGHICCPTVIYCSYTGGCGRSDDWRVDVRNAGLLPIFEGIVRFQFVYGGAYRFEEQEFYEGYVCIYQNSSAPNTPNALFGLVPKKGKGSYKLNGNWEYSGFMNRSAKCNSNNPLDCTAIKQK